MYQFKIYMDGNPGINQGIIVSLIVIYFKVWIVFSRLRYPQYDSDTVKLGGVVTPNVRLWPSPHMLFHLRYMSFTNGAGRP